VGLLGAPILQTCRGMLKKYPPFAVLVFVSGCISTTSLPVGDDEQITKICIERNPKVIVPGFEQALQEALLRRGITSTVSGTVPAACKYRLTYVAYQRWDFVMFMSNAHLDLYKGDTIIAYSDRHMPIGSGFDFSKWDSTETKVDELVGQLLNDIAPVPQADIQ